MFIGIAVLVRLFLTALALILGAMALSAWARRRRAPEAPIFALLILSAAIYCFGYSGEVAQRTLPRAMFWLRIEYLGIPWIPAFWLLGTRKQNRLRSRYSLIFAIPVITFVAQLTNSLHWLYDRSISLVPRGPFWVLVADRGPIAWLFIVYLYFAILYGAYSYISRFSAWGRSKAQAWLLVASSLVPLAGYLVYLCGWSPWGLDIAPITLGISAILWYFSVFQMGFFDLLPMAHSLVLSSMRDAVLVADLNHHLVDFNPAARELLPCLDAANAGDELASVLSEIPILAEALLNTSDRKQLTFETAEDKHFEVRILPLIHDERQVGTAAILAETTAQVNLVRELRVKAETDTLTGVANRRRFLAAVEQEWARSSRHEEAFSIAVVDLDAFKSINDEIGHHGGDAVLLTVADRIHRCLRNYDLLSRYGGDEFVILLPKTDEAGARQVAERICSAIAGTPIHFENQSVHATLSIGLATQKPNDTNWEETLKRADKALYAAKAQGRNRVAAWPALASSHVWVSSGVRPGLIRPGKNENGR